MANAPERVEQYPRKFGKYRILKPLAAGGMGAVYLAVTGAEGMEKLLAIKVVRPHLTDAEFIRRFEDEAKVVVRLDHGNLVQVFEVGDVEGQMYMAMEFVEGRDLRAVWNRCVEKRVAFPLDVVVQITKDALRGLSYAHEYGGLDLVHRDVSPPNLLVSFAGQTKVVDFGLALSNLKMQKTAPGLVFGKVSYMAPEQARGDKVDSRADLYALGIIVWELLTGRRLFPSSDNQAEDLVARSRGPVVEAPSQACSRVPKELDAVVLKALAPRPEDRFATARDMLRSLAEVQAALWPDLDTDRVATFMRLLYGDRIEAERTQAHELVVRSRSLGDGEDGGRVKVTVSGSEAAPLLGGRYRLGRMLGEGAMGQVFEAEHVDIGRRVAIKVLHRAYAKTEAAVERFRREARAATRIHHRAIVEVLDFGTTDDGRCYYVMELLSGSCLADIIDDEGPLDLSRALGLGLQMCSALEAAHAAGVVHRDLKPGNIVVTHDDEGNEVVKILDFGIAKWVDAPLGAQAKLTFGSVGTPKYMAPEQATGQPVDRRSDIYAIAVILYEMLTKKTPFGEGLPQELLARKLQKPPLDITQFRPDLPQGLAASIMAALEKDPDRRPATAAEFAAKLSRYLDQSNMPSRSPAFPVTASRAVPAGGPATLAEVDASSTPPVLPFALGGLAVILLLGLLFWWAPWSGQGEAGTTASGASGQLAAASGAGAGYHDAAAPILPRDGTAPDSRDGSAEPQESPALVDAAPPHPEKQPAPRLASRPMTSRPDGSKVDRPETANAVATLTGGADHSSRSISAGGPTSKRAQRAVRPRPPRSRAAAFGPRPSTARLAAGGNSARALALRAKTLLRQGKYAQAIRVADRAVKAGAGISARLTMARAYQRLGLYRSAAAQYRIILMRHPKHRAAKAGLAAVSKHL